MKKIDFLRKKDFECSFYKIEVYVVTNWSTRLENSKQLKFCSGLIFYAFLKILHFSNFFEIFVSQSQ